MSAQNRQPTGIPAGGQFAAGAQRRSTVTLGGSRLAHEKWPAWSYADAAASGVLPELIDRVGGGRSMMYVVASPANGGTTEAFLVDTEEFESATAGDKAFMVDPMRHAQLLHGSGGKKLASEAEPSPAQSHAAIGAEASVGGQFAPSAEVSLDAKAEAASGPDRIEAGEPVTREQAARRAAAILADAMRADDELDQMIAPPAGSGKDADEYDPSASQWERYSKAKESAADDRLDQITELAEIVRSLTQDGLDGSGSRTGGVTRTSRHQP